MQPVDLNLLFAKCAETGDIAGVERIIQASLNSKRALEVIRDTKQYHLLVPLHPLLQIRSDEAQILAEMYFDATVANDNEACGIISCFDLTDPVEQSVICAKKGYALEVLGEYGSVYGYVQGLIELDDVERFRATREKHTEQWQGMFIIEQGQEEDVRNLLEQYYAPKILDEVGYDRETLAFYLMNISFYQNTQLLHHIWEKKHAQQAVRACLLLKAEDRRAAYLHWILAQGVHLTETTWLFLQRQMPDIYAQLEQDV